jgi:hypothetical protein
MFLVVTCKHFEHFELVRTRSQTLVLVDLMHVATSFFNFRHGAWQCQYGCTVGQQTRLARGTMINWILRDRGSPCRMLELEQRCPLEAPKDVESEVAA